MTEKPTASGKTMTDKLNEEIDERIEWLAGQIMFCCGSQIEYCEQCVEKKRSYKLLKQCRDRLRWVPVSEDLPIPGQPVELINVDKWLNTPEGVPELNIRACAYLTEWGQKYWSVQGERGQDIDAYTHWRYSPPPQHSDQEKDSWV